MKLRARLFVFLFLSGAFPGIQHLRLWIVPQWILLLVQKLGSDLVSLLLGFLRVRNIVLT